MESVLLCALMAGAFMPGVLCADVEIEHLSDARASGVVKVWWNEEARKSFLVERGLAESNFVAACVGNTRIVCSMPSPPFDVDEVRCRIQRQEAHREMERDVGRRPVDREGESGADALLAEASNAFLRVQREREALVRRVGPSAQKQAGGRSDFQRQCESRREEEANRLDWLSKRLRAFGNDGGTGREKEKAWAAIDDEMRRRGVPAGYVECLRLEREVTRAHRADQLSAELDWRFREEMRRFERWLETRIAKDRMLAQREFEKSPWRRRESSGARASRPGNGRETDARIMAEEAQRRIANGRETYAQIKKDEARRKQEKRGRRCHPLPPGSVPGAILLALVFGGGMVLLYFCKQSGDRRLCEKRDPGGDRRPYEKRSPGVAHERRDWMGAVGDFRGAGSRAAGRPQGRGEGMSVSALRGQMVKKDSLRASSSEPVIGRCVWALISLIAVFGLAIAIAMWVSEATDNPYVGMAAAVGFLLVALALMEFRRF